MKKKNVSGKFRKAGIAASVIAAGPLLLSGANVFATDFSKAESISSSYPACKGVKIISDDVYRKDVEGWNAQLQTCGNKLQVSPKTGFWSSGFNDSNTLARSTNFMVKVAQRYKQNLENNIKELQKQQSCMSSGDSSKECQERRDSIHGMITKFVPEARMQLALSRGLVIGTQSPRDEENLNMNLEAWGLHVPTGIGGQMTADELAKAKSLYQQDKARVKQLVAEKMAKRAENLKKTHTSDTRSGEAQANLEKQAWDQVQGEHRQAYARILFDQAPLLAALPRQKGNGGSWQDGDIAKAIGDMIGNAQKEMKVVDSSLAKPKLEFERLASGERFVKSYLKGERDLLDYVMYKNVMNDVLKEDASYCSLATGLTQHLEDKNNQVAAVAGAGTMALFFAGGAGAALGALPAAGTYGVMAAAGVGMGAMNLHDSYRNFTETDTRVKSRTGAGQGETVLAGSEERKAAASQLDTSAAFHTLDYIGAGAAGKLLTGVALKSALKAQGFEAAQASRLIKMAESGDKEARDALATAQKNWMKQTFGKTKLTSEEDALVDAMDKSGLAGTAEKPNADFVSKTVAMMNRVDKDQRKQVYENAIKLIKEIKPDAGATPEEMARIQKAVVSIARYGDVKDPKKIAAILTGTGKWDRGAQDGLLHVYDQADALLAKAEYKKIASLQERREKAFKDAIKSDLRKNGVKDEKQLEEQASEMLTCSGAGGTGKAASIQDLKLDDSVKVCVQNETTIWYQTVPAKAHKS